MTKHPTPPPTKRLLTTKQVAEIYSVSVDFIQRRPVDELPKIKLGRRTVLYDVVDVEAYFRRYRSVA